MIPHVSAGFGRTRFISRYCRSLLPWLPVPRWFLALGLNSFLDQVRLRPWPQPV